MRPVLDYGSSVWDPPGVVLQEELESVQKPAARFVTGNYNYETGIMTGILVQLKWESLKKRRKDNRLILLYKGLKGKASVPTEDLIPKTKRCRNQHSMAFQTPFPLGFNDNIYHEGNISKMPDFDMFSLLEIRKRKSRSHGIRKKRNSKRKEPRCKEIKYFI